MTCVWCVGRPTARIRGKHVVNTWQIRGSFGAFPAAGSAGALPEMETTGSGGGDRYRSPGGLAASRSSIGGRGRMSSETYQ